MKVTGGDGCILVGGEVFAWRPWEGGDENGGKEEKKRQGGMINAKGQWEVGEDVWGVLGLVWPRPGGLYRFLSLS